MFDTESTADQLALANGEKMALSPRACARALSISERLLWSKTNCGEIPCVRIGKRVLYPTDLLRQWLAEQAKVTKR